MTRTLALLSLSALPLLAEPQQAIVDASPLTIDIPAGHKLSVLNLGTSSTFQPIPLYYVVANPANPSQELEFTSWTATNFYGPTKLRVKPVDSIGGAATIFISYEISPYTSGFNPLGAAVIPSDASGQFTVRMETSTDLVNWSQAVAGTYGSGSPNRFFRVAITRE